MNMLRSLDDFYQWREQLCSRRDPSAKAITICGGTGCTAFGSPDVFDAFERELAQRGLTNQVELKRTGCHGFCEKGPLLMLLPEGTFYAEVKPEDVPEIIERSVVGDEIIDRLLYVDPTSGDKIAHEEEIPFYAKQQRLVFQYNGRLDPVDLEDYVVREGYSALAKTLAKYTPEDVIEIVKKAGLRGRGGAGFPTGVKWEFTHKSPGEEKYLICNADEGDPGAFMDRSLLEGTPHAIIEGMAIAGYAIGASRGMIYVRAEYPMAVEHVTIALQQAREAGLLGKNILGCGFDFDLEVRIGAGAFVCGEETALIASLEGHRGMPRPRPPFPASKGFQGKPTNINNVETLANVPLIVRNGADWYRSIGIENNYGTKIFALAGKVCNTGLVEVPMGITLREVIFEIGGGIPDGKAFKAAQIGGPSGGCIPAEHLDRSIDYDSLKEIGAIMGSGGLIVMDESTCMVDIARYFLEFCQAECCGKCTPCRVGTRRMLETLERICTGEAKVDELDELEDIARKVNTASLCGLGQTAPNPVLSTIRYFRDEYEAHITDHKCPAGVCKELVHYWVDPELCKGCGKCRKACPSEAIAGERKEPHEILQAQCVKCGMCYEICPFDAITTT